MATQSGVVVTKVNDPYTVSSTIPRPSPGPKQVLVKPLAVGVNPVESFLKAGAMVSEWPAVMGADGCGRVVEVGAGCTRLKKDDVVFGCIRVGQNRHSTFQDAFLADEDIMLKKTSNMTVEDGAALGVGLMTAGLGLLEGCNVQMPEPGTVADDKDEWIIVVGGSGTVGQCAVQLGRLCGYKVLATCSASKASVPLGHGANATVNNRASVDEQLAEIKKITGGKFSRVFDSSTYGYDLCIKALDTCSAEKTKYFSTVDDWSPHDNTPASIREHRVQLGTLGHFDEEVGKKTSGDIAKWIPAWEEFIGSGALKPVEYQVLEGTGWHKVVEGIAILEGGKAGKKIIVRVQNA